VDKLPAETWEPVTYVELKFGRGLTGDTERIAFSDEGAFAFTVDGKMYTGDLPDDLRLCRKQPVSSALLDV
jgi:hypothetical protein